MTSRMSRWNLTRATKAVTETTAPNRWNPPAKGAASVPAGHSTCQAKNTARLT